MLFDGSGRERGEGREAKRHEEGRGEVFWGDVKDDTVAIYRLTGISLSQPREPLWALLLTRHTAPPPKNRLAMPPNPTFIFSFSFASEGAAWAQASTVRAP